MTDASDWSLLRKGLWPLSALYGLAVAIRNLTFDLGLRRVEGVSVPVISVGNLAAGGTGKTPLVVWLVRTLRDAGHNPGVLARGYGRAAGASLNDEGRLLARRFADLPQVQDPDRVAGARELVAGGADVIVVDDGFQHRRLRRDKDLVCLDTRRPFAGGMLPTGLLREFPRGLRRADAIVLTRAGRYDEEHVAERARGLQKLARSTAPAFVTDHVVARVVAMPDGVEVPLASVAGQRVHLLSAIARPDTFAETMTSLGAEITGHTVRPDHHLHTETEFDEVLATAEQQDAVVVTTEKDDVKLTEMDGAWWVVELDLEFLGEAPDVAWLTSGSLDHS